MNLEPGTSPLSPSRTTRWRWTIVLLAVWIGCLTTLALLFSNPVTVNVRQVRASNAVVHVRVEHGNTGQCSVLEDLLGKGLLGELILVNLRDTGAQAGREYLIPVQNSNGHWTVTTVPGSEHFAPVGPYIYPDTADARSQLEAALQSIPGTPSQL